MHPGLAVPLEVRLGEPAVTGELRVRIIDPSGDFPESKRRSQGPNFSARVDGIGPVRRHYRIKTSAFCGNGIAGWFVRVEREGRWVIEAVLRDVPMGEYRVAFTSRGSLLTPRSRTIRPGETASFTLVQEG